MRKLALCGGVLVLLVAVWAIGSSLAVAQVDSNDNNVALMDDCAPGDPGWTPTGGCGLLPHQGDVSFAEFNALLVSPLSAAIIGHPSWRNEPSYLTIKAGQKVRVTNRGGRGHTFTEVQEFGGGFVPPLNGVGAPGKVPLIAAAECTPPPGTVVLAPGAAVQLSNLGPGLHRFQCCIHPWMRAAIRVQ